MFGEKNRKRHARTETNEETESLDEKRGPIYREGNRSRKASKSLMDFPSESVSLGSFEGQEARNDV